MSTNTLNVYAAVQEAGAAALSMASLGPCEACGAPASPPYAFVYGRETGSDTQTASNTQTTTTYYGDIQGRAVNLCDACVAQARRAAGRKLTAITGGLAGIGVLSVLGAFVVGGRLADVLPAIGLAFFIFALLAYVRLRSVQRVPREAGQRLALDLHVDALKRQGYDAFWSGSAEVGAPG